jgi:BirA family biotin operon repressor/biotin-[acetyl-CoA-carboxylase] ligase
LPLPSVIQPLGTPFIELQSVDSTNNYALSQIHANMSQPGTCYFAHEQVTGKGQRGKSWATEREANIILSLVLKPTFLQPLQQFQLSACIAVATHQFLSRYIKEDLKIKWPNDLYWQDKKLGGILIENIIRNTGQGISKWEWAVAGIGININQANFPAELKNPVSLKLIRGKEFDPVGLAKELCSSIDHFYKKLANEETISILKLYNQFLYKKDRIVTLKKDSRKFEALIKAVDTAGHLIVQHGVEERYDFGEIEWLM